MRRAFIALLLITACRGEHPATTSTAVETTTTAKAATPPPAAAQARELIAASPEFGEFEFTNASFSLPKQKPLRGPLVEAAANDLRKAGWIAIEGQGDVALTEKSRNDRRFLVRQNDVIDIVPLAKKEMGNVSAVRPDANGTAAVDFDWKWIPNEVGSAFQSGEIHDRFAAGHLATATLIWDGTSWSVLKIEPRAAQP